jgi:ADP-heptose:LPS heptosyltransferase
MTNRILISRTDGIGDVVLTLPLAGFLKKQLPNSKISFLCSEYSKPVVERSVHVDAIVNWTHLSSLPKENKLSVFQEFDTIIHVFPNKIIASLAKEAKIALRVGTSHRWFHWFTCNRMVHFSRKSSPLHEAQLNFKLLHPLGFKDIPVLEDICGFYGINAVADKSVEQYFAKDKFNIVLHPKSKGNGREWSIDNYNKLIGLLKHTNYKIFITGSESERNAIAPLLVNNPMVIDMVGKLPLEQFVTFLSGIDLFISAGTGPLHLSAALGKKVIGMFPPIKPIYPTRWAPLGTQATYMVKGSVNCGICRKNGCCVCVNSLTPEEVFGNIKKLLNSNE